MVRWNSWTLPFLNVIRLDFYSPSSFVYVNVSLEDFCVFQIFKNFFPKQSCRATVVDRGRWYRSCKSIVNRDANRRSWIAVRDVFWTSIVDRESRYVTFDVDRESRIMCWNVDHQSLKSIVIIDRFNVDRESWIAPSITNFDRELRQDRSFQHRSWIVNFDHTMLFKLTGTINLFG